MIPIISNKKVASDYVVITKSRAEVEAEWDEIVRALKGNFLHSLAWSRYIAESYEKPSFFLVQRSGQTVAAGWYTLFGKIVGLIEIVQYIQWENLPCYDPERISPNDVFREVYSLATREKCFGLQFGNSSQECHMPGVKGSLHGKISFSIDLQKSLAEIRANFSTKHRKKIRKAEHSALRIKCLKDSEAYALIPELEGLFDYSYRRHCALGKERHRHKSSIVRDIIQELVLTGNALIFVAFYSNIPVSCYVVSTFNRQASNIYSASSAMGYELHASFLLIWREIEYFKDNNYLELNLGAVPEGAKNEADCDHGLYRYKSGFGARTCVLYSGTMILHPMRYAVVSALLKLKSAVKSFLPVLR